MSDRTKSSKAIKKAQQVVDLDSTKNVTPAVPTPVAQVNLVAEVAQEVRKGTKRSSKKEAQVTDTTQQQPVTSVTTNVKKVKTARAKPKKTVKKQKTDAESEATEATEATTQNGENAPEEDGKRYFRCVFKDSANKIVKSGRYSGKKPQQAARKALRCIVKKNNVTSGTSVLFVMRECTRNSKKKPYMYSGFCAKLETPIEVPITKKDGTKSSIKYYHGQPKVTKATQEECDDLLNAVFHDDNVAQDQVAEEEVVKVRVEKRSSRKAKATQEGASADVPATAKATQEGATAKAAQEGASADVPATTEPVVEQKPRKKSKKEVAPAETVVVEAVATPAVQVVAPVVASTPAEQKPAKKSKAKADSK
jgi:hypothetical protein